VRTLSFSEPREPIPRNLINDIAEYNILLTPCVDVLRFHVSLEAGLRLLPALITPELTDISLSFDENLYVYDRPLDLDDLIKSVYMTIFRCTPKLVHFSATLRMHGLYTNADIALILSGVVAAVSKESLQKIIITSVLSNNDLSHWDADSGIDTCQFILDIHAIEQALQFQNLEIFSACLGVPLYLTDEDHLRIAQTWRSVQLLYLSSIVQRVIRTHKPPASIASLVHYARYCHRLKALGLCLDASTKASVDACVQAVDACGESIPETNFSLPSPSIQMVEFGPSWLECNFDPVQINSLAKVFTRIFSNLAACCACRTEELGVLQAAWTWVKVQTLYEYILFVDQGCNANTPLSTWKLKLFSKVCRV
jgi:hypothetical protein